MCMLRSLIHLNDHCISNHGDKLNTSIWQVFDGTLHDMVSEKLMSLVSSARPEPDKFLTCVHKLQQNYPPIADR